MIEAGISRSTSTLRPVVQLRGQPAVVGCATPAIFLDRDGVIIADRSDYVRSHRDVQLLPGSIDALARLAASSYAVIVVTNQSAVGRGLLALEKMLEINRQLMDRLASLGGKVDASYICPHAPEVGCPCRKPAPGMLLDASAELGLDLASSFLVGDAVTDLMAARAACVRGMLVRTGRGAEQSQLLAARERAASVVVADLSGAVDQILGPDRGLREDPRHGRGGLHRQRGHRATGDVRS